MSFSTLRINLNPNEKVLIEKLEHDTYDTTYVVEQEIKDFTKLSKTEYIRCEKSFITNMTKVTEEEGLGLKETLYVSYHHSDDPDTIEVLGEVLKMLKEHKKED